MVAKFARPCVLLWAYPPPSFVYLDLTGAGIARAEHTLPLQVANYQTLYMKRVNANEDSPLTGTYIHR